MTEGVTINHLITERDWRQTVVDCARVHGWKAYWTWNSLHSPAGFPDLVLVRGRQIAFAELKSERGRVRPEQEEWLADLERASRANPGVSVFVWRPSDWDGIEEFLSEPEEKAA